MFWRLVPVAIAATILIGFFVFAVRTPGTASAEIAPEKIARPIAELQILNEQSRRTSEMMLQTLALDLRTLQFELNCIEHLPNTDDVAPLEPAEVQLARQKLSLLAEKLQQLQLP